ncbi:PEP-CTERM sorting domain-containing protein [Edaphobacter albus]|uniref:PEP-CTERM sorting domain-containing protein n=1 Tax=Edaphobacter sp. 4G125 TaxID=2763071 RepID=UPI0016461324|nr:PEP-CTERM sorting domain-containing protein [Edaphobacter sp. 4G125]QNI37140.1 PEP-CTERM sorting domain-containing protein [Edaphobacter sp. 4G125]
MKKIGLAVLLLAGTVAYADTITLVSDPAKNYQQSTNSPCVIGNASCKNPVGLDYTLIKSNVSSYPDTQSPTYTVSQILGVVNSTSFWIGIDINQTSETQYLGYFDMFVNGIKVAGYDPSEPTPVPAVNNGNGYADYLLQGFSLAGFAESDQVFFTMAMPIANDGAEQFFLIGAPAPPAVPEPSTIALLGTGLVSAAGIARRKLASR